MKVNLLKLSGCTMVSLLIAASAYAQQQPGSQQQPGAQPGIQPGAPTGRDTGYTSRQGAHQPLRASKLMRAKVTTAQGEQLGTIEEVVVNPQNGRVLSISAATGTETERPATTATGARGRAGGSSLPCLEPLDHSQDDDRIRGRGQEQITLIARIDRQKLQQAPSFEKNRWPDMSQQNWTQQVYSHYGVEPELGAGGTGPGSSIDSSGAGKKSSSDDSKKPSSPSESKPDSPKSEP